LSDLSFRSDRLLLFLAAVSILYPTPFPVKRSGYIGFKSSFSWSKSKKSANFRKIGNK